jgi:hypothetical protein
MKISHIYGAKSNTVGTAKINTKILSTLPPHRRILAHAAKHNLAGFAKTKMNLTFQLE